VYIIEIRDEIGRGLGKYISRGIKAAEKDNADAIIFDINTPGGELRATQEIIESIYNTHIPTIAYVNIAAYSAGSIIAIACDQIVMHSGSMMGATAPVHITGEKADEKAVSAVSGMIRSAAQKQGRNEDIAAAMVDKNLVLVEMKGHESLNGEIVSLRPEEYEKKEEAGEIEKVISAEGELLTLTKDDALKYGFADAQAESIEELLSIYEIVDVQGKRKALTSDAIFQKQSEDIALNKIKSLDGSTTHQIRMTLAEHIAIFITSPMISALLLSLGTIGLLIELRTPGFGFPGIIGILCLALFFGGHTIANINTSYAALAFVVGLGLLMFELFVTPGFGVTGVLGILLMFGGILFIFGKSYNPKEAVLWLSISFIATFGLGVVAFYTLPRTRTWQQFVLSTAEDSELGYQAPPAELENYAGKTGRAVTPLRPAGTAIIDGSRVDVVTEGNFISNDTPVKVVKVEGMKVIVQEIEE
jgi:membrane-bound serine protease (ClpP class)